MSIFYGQYVLKLCFSELEKLTLLFVAKKSYEISQPFHLILAPLINLECTAPLILVYTPYHCEILSTYFSLNIVQDAG